jgi:hypothetical protein
VSQYLRLFVQWNHSARGIHVVVSFTTEDMEVSATQPDSAYADQEFVGSDFRNRDFTHAQLRRGFQNGGSHGLIHVDASEVRICLSGKEVMA